MCHVYSRGPPGYISNVDVGQVCTYGHLFTGASVVFLACVCTVHIRIVSVVVPGDICNLCVRIHPVCNEGKVLLSLSVCMYTRVCVFSGELRNPVSGFLYIGSFRHGSFDG